MAKEKKSTRRAAGKKAFRTRVRKAKAAGKKSIKVGNRRVKITHALSGAKRRKDSGPNFGGVRRKKRRGGRKAKAEASPVRRKRRKSESHKRRSTPRTKHHHHTKVITKRRTVEVKVPGKTRKVYLTAADRRGRRRSSRRRAREGYAMENPLSGMEVLGGGLAVGLALAILLDRMDRRMQYPE